jgi:hypothetical protein
MRTRTKTWRPYLEILEDRCTPSALLGNPAAHALTPLGEPAAALSARTAQHAVPIKLSAHITADGSGVLSLTGNASHLGRWTGQGVIDNVAVDVAADRVAISSTATIVAANGDQLFVSVSVSLSLTTRLGEETLTITGGTGRFAGASGSMSLVCDTTWDPTTPLTFECNGQGAGTLIFAH